MRLKLYQRPRLLANIFFVFIDDKGRGRVCRASHGSKSNSGGSSSELLVHWLQVCSVLWSTHFLYLSAAKRNEKWIRSVYESLLPLLLGLIVRVVLFFASRE